MRRLLQPKDKPLLVWLLERDAQPSAVPVFPGGEDLSLVTAYLLNGVCYAEVLNDCAHLEQICSGKFPFGRLFFHIKQQDINDVCAD
jgi:hypothetical protein